MRIPGEQRKVESRKLSTPLRTIIFVVNQDELREYMSDLGQTWREDSSNECLKYKRNRVRLELIPIMAELAGGSRALSQRLDTMSRQSRAYRAWLESSALAWEDEFFPVECADRLRHVLPLEPLQAVPAPVQMEIIHRFIAASPHLAAHNAITSVPYDQLERVLERINDMEGTDWSLHLTKSVAVGRVGTVLRCVPAKDDDKNHVSWQQLCSRGGGDDLWLGVSSQVAELLERAGCKVHILTPEASGEALGSSPCHVRPGSELSMRLRQDGDRLRVNAPAGSRSRIRKVSEILRDEDVPRHLRDEAIVLEASWGEEPPEILAIWMPDTHSAKTWTSKSAHHDEEGSDASSFSSSSPARFVVHLALRISPEPEPPAHQNI